MDNRSPLIADLCRRLLRPLAAILIRCGVTYRAFCDMAKSVFVDVALTDFGRAGRPASVSKVAMLTGMTRREVSRQRDLLLADTPPQPDRAHSVARILNGWYTDPAYLDAAGQPRALPEHGPVSFESLYHEHRGTDVPLSTTLRALIDAQAVTRSQDGLLNARSRAFVPTSTDTTSLARVGTVIGDVSDTVRHNLYRHPKAYGRFERSATSVHIPETYVSAFQDYLQQRGQAFVEDIDAWLRRHAHEGNDRNDDCGVRIGVGVYEIHADSPAARQTASDPPRAREGPG